MLDLVQVQSFVAVIETGSFHDAARRLSRAQPTIPQHVRKLDEELGVALVRRSHARCLPTTKGETFLPHARQLLRACEEVRSALDHSRFVVGAASNLGIYLLPPLVRTFRDRSWAGSATMARCARFCPSRRPSAGSRCRRSSACSSSIMPCAGPTSFRAANSSASALRVPSSRSRVSCSPTSPWRVSIRRALSGCWPSLHGICKGDGLTSIVSLHQLGFARAFADRIVALAGGEVVFDGPPGSLGDAEVARIYGRRLTGGGASPEAELDFNTDDDPAAATHGNLRMNRRIFIAGAGAALALVSTAAITAAPLRGATRRGSG